MTGRMIFFSTNHRYLRFPGKEILRTLKNVYKEEGRKIPGIAVICTNNRYIRKINKKYLMHDYITDVIAFSLGEDGDIEAEIYINLDAARNQAKRYNVTYTQEVMRLLIHGALHLLGYDDKNQRDKKNMNSREDYLLELMNRKAKL